MNEFIRVRVTDAGRVVIPAEFRRELGIGEGDEVLFRKDEAGIHISTVAQAIRDAQTLFALHVPKDVSLADELARERRDEAASD